MKYIIKRLLYVIPSILIVLFIVFLLTRIVPGDPARLIGGEQATEESLENIREELGLNKSIPEQFVIYIKDISKGDFGTAWHTGKPVKTEFAERFSASLELALLSMLIAISIGIPLGVMSAVKKGSLFDKIATNLTLLGTSLPIFWLGFMMIYLLYYKTSLLPAPMGRLSVGINPPTHITGLYLIDSILTGDFIAFWDTLKHLVMPAICLSMSTLAVIARMSRSNMLDILNKDFMRTARAKGLKTNRIIFTHGFRNILVPVLTVIGAQFGSIIGNSVITETIFAWPGVGNYVTNSILAKDYAPVQAFVMASVMLYIFINLALDILYAVVDPRIRYGK